jgi:hypothetical protein
MHRSLDTISEDDEQEQVRTGSTDTTEYSDLPEVSPKTKTRSFDPATIRRQTEANLALREKLPGSSDTAEYEDLPTVTPKVRSFADTIKCQNTANKALRKDSTINRGIKRDRTRTKRQRFLR